MLNARITALLTLPVAVAALPPAAGGGWAIVDGLGGEHTTDQTLELHFPRVKTNEAMKAHAHRTKECVRHSSITGVLATPSDEKRKVRGPFKWDPIEGPNLKQLEGAASLILHPDGTFSVTDHATPPQAGATNPS